MTLKKTDRRIIRTRRMIMEAFTVLIEEKGFEAITVSDLTEKADINRGTFYQHYRILSQTAIFGPAKVSGIHNYKG